MKKRVKVSRFLIMMGAVLYVISRFFDGGVALVLLCLAAAAMAVVCWMDLFTKRNFDSKLADLMIFCLACSGLFYNVGADSLGVFFSIGTTLVGIVLVFRLFFFLNKYCDREVEKHLDD